MTKPQKPKIKIIEPITKNDFEEITKLVDLNLAPGEVDLDYLYSLPAGSIYLAKVGDEISGVVISRLPAIFFREIPEKFISLDLIKQDKEKIGNIHIIIISPKFRRLGIGKRLVKKALEYLNDFGVAVVLVHVWMQSPGNSSFELFSALGFKPLKLYKKSWSEYPNYICVRCGSPCQCDSLEMVLDLTAEK